MKAKPKNQERFERAWLSLEGLSIGDALGECFFAPAMQMRLAYRALPEAPWFYTDDTVMAYSIVEVLAEHDCIEQDILAQRFARRFNLQPNRGYGGGAIRLLDRIAAGFDWRQESAALFDGQGSMGNGAAMRAAPIGAYFADDLDTVVEQSAKSAVVTQVHPDGQAGAVAIAVAAALACKRPNAPMGAKLLEEVVQAPPAGQTRDGIKKAIDIESNTPVTIAATALGSGQRVLSSDTVPFALWNAAHRLTDFEDAMWSTASGLGDVDTTCAMVGGIVALAVGREGLPTTWIRKREPLEL